MVVPPEIKIGLADLKAYLENNPLSWQQPAQRWAIGAMLGRFNGLLTDCIDFDILQNKELLETFFHCSKTITSSIESVGIEAIDTLDKSNTEPEMLSKVFENAEDSSVPQASNTAGMSPKNLTSDSTFSTEDAMASPADPLSLGSEIDQKQDSILEDTPSLTGSRSSVGLSEDIDHLITRHSENQLSLDPTKTSDEIPTNTDESSIVYGESHGVEGTTYVKTTYTAESDEPPKMEKKNKNKKKSKKKKSMTIDATEEAILTSIEISNSPTLVLPMVKDYVSPVSLMPDRLMAPSDAEASSTSQAVATTTFSGAGRAAPSGGLDATFSRFKLEKALEALRLMPIEESRQQSVGDLKTEHQKTLADLTKKHEAIKFENKNLKADRNKELEKLRRENLVLRERSSGLDQEMTQLRTELHLLKSKVVIEESRVPPEVVPGHAEELEFIIRHQCHIIAYEIFPEMWDEVNRAEEKDDDEKSSTRLKFVFKTLQGKPSWDITTYPYMSEGARKLCKVMKKIRVSNAILRTRCQWYWNQLHEVAQAKRKTLTSLLKMENSAILYEAETFDLKEQIRNLEKSLNIRKRSPGVRTMNIEKKVMQKKFGILELTISELKDEVYSLKRCISKLNETKKTLLENSATGELRQTAELEEAICKEQSKTKRFSSKIQELQGKVKALEKERATVESLIEIGVAVRKRFFEQAKYAVSLGEIFSRPDHKIIQEGNDRCHRAYCLTDAALFKLFYLSGSTNEAIYNRIYHVNSHAAIMNFPLKLCQALDSNASIKTVRVINDSITSQELRTEAEQLFFSIIECWNANLQEDIFDANEEVSGWLSQLHDLEKQIIRIDRSKEYRGYAEEFNDGEETSHSEACGWGIGEPGDMAGADNWCTGQSGGMIDTGDWRSTH
ncbi:hypothetical protein ACHAP3_006702 [Botrytis cinerea]